MITNKIDKYIYEYLDDSLIELGKLCAIPSIAAQNTGLEEGAQCTADLLIRRGFATKIIPTLGAPVVVAEREGTSDKTLLFYNHYDVQPAEPFELWDSPPFKATRRDGKLFARGVSDDKGHITSRLLAIDALLDSLGELPCNVKFVVEGEEEIGSVHIPDFIENNLNILKADACIWEFGGVDHREVPQMVLGMRGICYVELSVKTASTDVHSGLGGSLFPNSAWRLIWALGTLKNQDETVNLPGYYDPIIPPTERDWEMMAVLPDLADEYHTRYGVQEFLKGVTGGAALRIQESFEPTCTICGLTSGYQGPGSKTVLPAQASAKVDFRLALGQTPELILTSLRSHLDKHGFEDVTITYLGGEAAGRTDPDDPFIQLVIDAGADVFDKPFDVIPMIGGSGPNHAFIEHLKLPIATSGVGHPGSNAHAPNENIRIDLYEKGARHAARILLTMEHFQPR